MQHRDFLGVCLGFVLGFTACAILCAFARDAERNEAVKAGVGRYVADPSSGAVRFVYGAKGESDASQAVSNH